MCVWRTMCRLKRSPGQDALNYHLQLFLTHLMVSASHRWCLINVHSLCDYALSPRQKPLPECALSKDLEALKRSVATSNFREFTYE